MSKPIIHHIASLWRSGSCCTFEKYKFFTVQHLSSGTTKTAIFSKNKLTPGALMMKHFNCTHFMSAIAFFFLSINSICVFAQGESNDDRLLDELIASKGYTSSIIFDASNIKRFWPDKTVMSQNGEIVVLLPNGTQKHESFFQKIQLANVNQTLDCKVDVITNTPDLYFSIADKSSSILSSSAAKEDFIHYHIVSASFHLEDLIDYSFSLKFSSIESNQANIKKIVLSFSTNTDSSFLISPGTLLIGKDGVVVTNATTKDTDDKNSISVTGKNTRVISKKKIIVSDNVLKNSVSVKNTGDKPTRVYLGYIPYTKDGTPINNNVNPYKDNNQILKVLSHEKGSKKIIVDSFPELWAKGCRLALNIKEDLSDFPNTNLVEGKIQEINKTSDNHAEIVFDKTIKNAVAPGTLVRIHAPNGSTFMSPTRKVLEPGEEIKLSSSVQKDDSCSEFSSRVFCKGTYYVVPIVLSYSVDSNDENTVLIREFSVSY